MKNGNDDDATPRRTPREAVTGRDLRNAAPGYSSRNAAQVHSSRDAAQVHSSRNAAQGQSHDEAALERAFDRAGKSRAYDRSAREAGGSAAAKDNSSSHRVQRVERELRDVVGSYLLGGFRGSLPGIVSITRVICSKDLRTAKIFVTVMGLSLENRDGLTIRDLAVDELQAHAFEVQREINLRLKLRHCPRVSFLYDEGFENVIKVERILRELSEERERAAAGLVNSDKSN